MPGDASNDDIQIVYAGSDGAGEAATALERAEDGLDTVVAGDVDQVLDDVDGHQVDAVVSEYPLPDRNGVALLDALRRRFPELPVVLYATADGPRVAAEAVQHGATDYVPAANSDPAELAAVVRSAVEDGDGVGARWEPTRALQELAGATDDVLLLLDEGQETVLFVNAAYGAVWGRPVGALATGPGDLFDGVHPEDREAVRAALDRLADGETVDVECRVNPAEEYGRWVWIRGQPVGEAGTVDGIALVARDVTERTERAATREEYLEYMGRIIDAFDDLFFVHDTAGQLQRWNDSFAAVTGYSDAELESMNGVDLVAESARERTAAAIREVFETGHARLEAPLLTKDGTTIPYQFAANAVEHPSGELRLVGVGRDVTDHREYESQLERQNERLEEFASVVSHDLRNPLNVAVGQLELARGDCESEHLDTVASALDRIDEIIESSLTLAREGSTIEEPEPVDVSDLARRCWTTVDTGAATLRVPETVRVEADESRLRNVIENLMQNAVKYGGEDVTVTVGSLDGGFYVADDGPGIPEDERERVFEAGTSLGHGSGLGLAIVKRIAEAHGWTVTLTESEGGGARFEFHDVTVL